MWVYIYILSLSLQRQRELVTNKFISSTKNRYTCDNDMYIVSVLNIKKYDPEVETFKNFWIFF